MSSCHLSCITWFVSLWNDCVCVCLERKTLTKCYRQTSCLWMFQKAKSPKLTTFDMHLQPTIRKKSVFRYESMKMSSTNTFVRCRQLLLFCFVSRLLVSTARTRCLHCFTLVPWYLDNFAVNCKTFLFCQADRLALPCWLRLWRYVCVVFVNCGPSIWRVACDV